MPSLGNCSRVEWEDNMIPNREEKLPLFVYGTLMSGQRAYDRLRYAVTRFELAALADTALYSLGEYPMAVPGGDGVIGELHWLIPKLHDRVLTELDEYEGVGFGYTRERVRVKLAAPVHGAVQHVDAWVYYGMTHIAVQHPQIVSGDWRQYQRERGA